MAQAPRAPTAVALLALPLAVSLLFPGMARAEATRDRLWREDLGTFATQLRAVHPKPFAHVAEARFDSALHALEARVPDLSDAGVCVGVMRLAAMLEDGHTLVLPTSRAMGFGQVIPVRLAAFDDGLAVVAVAPAYARYAGARTGCCC